MTHIGPYSLNSIITGDARVLAQEIPPESVDLVLTDPPFGIGFDYGSSYTDDPLTYLDFMQWIVEESNRVIKPGGFIFIFQAMPRLRETWALCPATSRIFAACKNFVQMRPIPVQFSTDPVIFWQKPGRALQPHRGRDWHIGNQANTQARGLKDAGFHACPRPLDTIRYMVANFSPVGGLVLDWCMGSGTTAVAAVLEGRNFWGCEIEASTADHARARVQSLPARLPFNTPEQLRMETVP